MPSRFTIHLSSIALLALLAALPAQASATDNATAPLDPPALEWNQGQPLRAFEGAYRAFYRGKPAGDATLALKQLGSNRWEVSLDVRGNRGVVSVLGLNLYQSTEFEVIGNNQFRPLTQRTVRKGLFLGKRLEGRYDWSRHQARWSGDLDKKRQLPVPLQDGDLSALLINLALIRDASPSRQLEYRFADAGRARLHRYQFADATAPITVEELSYDALRAWRTNTSTGNAMELWVANGVPTPVRISQHEEGQPGLDLHLIEYKEVE